MSDGDFRYIEEFPSETGGGRLGRNVLWHDPENRDYPARGVLFDQDAPFTRKSWWARHLFDQGSESSCTAQAAAGVLHTSPNRLELDRTNLTALDEPKERYELYREAQKHDPWPEENYEGSSTDAPFKVLRNQGRIKEWRWCFGLEDVLKTLGYHGPVAIGTTWWSGFDTPRADGFVEPTGWTRGGHAYELYGVTPDLYPGGGYVSAINSWGSGYGIKGRFRMSWATLRTLLEGQNGEAVTVVL